MEITVDDRLYLTDEDIMISESKLYKFGLKVGTITLTMIKND